MRFISRSQLTRPTSVVYEEGAADDEDGDAMARAAAGEGVALAQEKLRRTAAAAASGFRFRFAKIFAQVRNDRNSRNSDEISFLPVKQAHSNLTKFWPKSPEFFENSGRKI